MVRGRRVSEPPLGRGQSDEVEGDRCSLATQGVGEHVEGNVTRLDSAPVLDVDTELVGELVDVGHRMTSSGQRNRGGDGVHEPPQPQTLRKPLAGP